MSGSVRSRITTEVAHVRATTPQAGQRFGHPRLTDVTIGFDRETVLA